MNGRMDARGEARPDDGPVLIFDGVCVLCSASVQFILRHERDDALRFAPLQSPAGIAIAAAHGMTRDDLDGTFLLVEHGRALDRSDAALAVAAHLSMPWRAARLFRFIPRVLRDGVYSSIARRRYRIFGKTESCFIPAPGTRHRFLG